MALARRRWSRRRSNRRWTEVDGKWAWPERGQPPRRCEPGVNLASRVLLRTAEVAVLDKPPDCRMDGTHTEVTMTRLARRWLGTDEVRWVHRLDYGTSGVLCAALSKTAAAAAGSALATKAATKTYVAVCVGRLPGDCVIEARLETKSGFRVAACVVGGKPATTVCRVAGRGRFKGRSVTKLHLQPLTGRRHQLRVHLASLGFPLLGDMAYGACRLSALAPRMMLHALRLDLPLGPAGGLLRARTPDPFPFDRRGRLHPKRPAPLSACTAVVLRSSHAPPSSS